MLPLATSIAKELGWLDDLQRDELGPRCEFERGFIAGVGGTDASWRRAASGADAWSFSHGAQTSDFTLLALEGAVLGGGRPGGAANFFMRSLFNDRDAASNVLLSPSAQSSVNLEYLTAPFAAGFVPLNAEAKRTVRWVEGRHDVALECAAFLHTLP